MISWTLLIQILILLFLLVLLATKAGRQSLTKSSDKLIKIATSKRFITLMIATWFVYQKIPIDGNWLLLAGFYIGIDTAHNNGVFAAYAEYLKTKKKGAPDGQTQ